MQAAAYIALLLLISSSLRGDAADWPMFRGSPELNGVAQGSLPDKLSLLWSFKTAAPVKSSAVIAGDHVFIGSGDSNLYALNLKDGKKIWSFRADAPVDAPALFANGSVYVGAIDGALYALDTKTGKLRWKYQTDDKILGAPNLSKNINGSIQLLVGSYDYRLHAIDAETGKSNWVYESSNYINGSPAVSDGQTVFGGCDGLLHIISLADGKQAKEIEAGAYVAASVAIADRRAYFGHYDNEFLCIDLQAPETWKAEKTNESGSAEVLPRPVRNERGEDRGEGKTPQVQSSSPQPSPPFDGREEGKTSNVVWRFRDKNFPYLSSAAITKDAVLFGGRDKHLHCVNREDGKELWSFATQGKVDSSPVVVGNKVVVGSDDGRVYVVSLKEGKELWSYEIGAPVGSSPAISDGKIVIGSDDGSVYCFGGKGK